jgi:hypothetical protein
MECGWGVSREALKVEVDVGGAWGRIRIVLVLEDGKELRYGEVVNPGLVLRFFDFV